LISNKDAKLFLAPLREIKSAYIKLLVNEVLKNANDSAKISIVNKH
jgi:hypothetical protein